MNTRLPWLILIGLLFTARIWLAVSAKHGDMYNNLDWGRIAVERGLSGFYDLPKEIWPHSRANQPPGSILLHAASIHISNFGTDLINTANRVSVFPSRLVWWWETYGDLISIKLPSIVADFAIAAALIHLGKYWNRQRIAGAIALVYLVNPAMWYSSSFWGQTDAVVAAFTVWSLACLLTGRTAWASLLLGLSLITKLSWAPLVPLWLVYYLRNYRSQLSHLLIGPAAALVVSLPFHPALDFPVWLTNLFASRILPGESAYITVNAFNFWALFFPFDGASVNSLFLGVRAAMVAYGLAAVWMVWALRRVWLKPFPAGLLYSASVLFFAVFLFSSRMHERYLYPVFPLLSLLLLRIPIWLLWPIIGALSGIYLFNIYHLWWAPHIPSLVAVYSPVTIKLAAGFYLIAFFALVKLKSLRHIADE